MATARFDMRLDSELKEKAEKASALLGTRSLTEYIVNLLEENSTKVIAEHESMVVENDIFDQFLVACEKADEPNQALREAADFTRANNIR